MTEFCRGRSQDQEEIIDFINMVFSQNSVPHDFKTLLPKLYGDDADTGCCHFLAKGRGRTFSDAVSRRRTTAEAGAYRFCQCS